MRPGRRSPRAGFAGSPTRSDAHTSELQSRAHLVCRLLLEKKKFAETHANFIVTRGGASSADVLALITRAHEAVRERYGIDLSPEVKFLGFGG